MNKLIRLMALWMIGVSPLVYAKGPDSLVGCYAMKQGGAPRVMVQKRDGKYLLSIATNWRASKVGHEPTEQEVKKLFGGQAKFYEDGVYSGELGVFKVHHGMIVHNRPMSGTYFAVLGFFGSGEIYSVSCP